MKKYILLLVMMLLLSVCIYGQEKYALQEYLGQTNISGLTISPNGKFILAQTTYADFKEDKMIRQLWRIELDKNQNVVEQLLIDNSGNSYTQFKWLNDNVLYVMINGQLHKMNMSGGLAVPLKIPAKGFLVNWEILDDKHFLLVCTTTQSNKTSEKVYGKAIRVDYSEPVSTIFYKYAIDSGKTDSLFSVPAMMADVKISPDKKKALFTSISSEAFHTSTSVEQSELAIYEIATGKQLYQITKNHVYEEANWLNSEELIGTVLGDIKATQYNIDQPQFFKYKLGDKDIQLQKDSHAYIRKHILQDAKIVLFNADLSTRNNFFTMDLSNQSIKPVSDFQGAVTYFEMASNSQNILFSMVTADTFDEIYIAKNYKEFHKAKKITNFNAKLSKMPKPIIEKIEWKNSDNETIEGILIWPPNKKGANNLPFAIDIHGGPWALRHENISSVGLQYYYYGSFLASHGFLVLQPNYSGSVGRGDNFFKAINGKAITKPTDDILKGVEFLIAKGWIDENKMLVMGASYGGVLTNAIIGKTNQFKLALSSCGNWSEMLGVINDNQLLTPILFGHQTVWENNDLYQKESASHYIKNIRTPTLITFGQDDRRVPTVHGYAMYRALKAQNVPTELILLPSEGHVYRKPSNMLTKVKIELYWIKKYLGIDIPTE